MSVTLQFSQNYSILLGIFKYYESIIMAEINKERGGVKAEVKIDDGIINITQHIKQYLEGILLSLQDLKGYEHFKGESITNPKVTQELLMMYIKDSSMCNLLDIQNSINNNRPVTITGFVRKQHEYEMDDGNNVQQLVGFRIHDPITETDRYVRLEQRYRTVVSTAHGLEAETIRVGATGYSTLTATECSHPEHIDNEGLNEYIKIYSAPSTPRPRI